MQADDIGHRHCVISDERGERTKQTLVSNKQCWASYSKNVIYYSLLVTTPFKSDIVLYLLISGNSN